MSCHARKFFGLPRHGRNKVRRLSPSLSLIALHSTILIGVPTPAVGAKAPDFTLSTSSGKAVKMPAEQRGHTLVLVVLRGFPGYQCPFCVKQVHDFVDHASDFSAKHAKVLLVYPGPPADLDQHAKEFLEKQADLPANIVLVTDPDYKVTNLYGLCWDAPHETAYPSTFVLDKKGVVFSRRSVIVTATAYPQKPPWSTFQHASDRRLSCATEPWARFSLEAS